MRALDADLEIAHRTWSGFQDTLDIFQHKFEGGAASGLEVARAQAALSNVAAVIPDLRRQIVAQENALNLLLGRNPGPIARGGTLADQFDPPEVPTGLPAPLLERRPDLREAEQNLIAANANVGVAKANFFPTHFLEGTVWRSKSSTFRTHRRGQSLEPCGQSGRASVYSRALEERISGQLAQRDQAQIAFEKSGTQAFGEVSTSLSAHQELAGAYREETAAVEAYRESVRLSKIRYDSGLSNYFEIIDAEIQMYPAETFRDHL